MIRNVIQHDIFHFERRWFQVVNAKLKGCETTRCRKSHEGEEIRLPAILISYRNERNALNILRIVCSIALTSDPNQSHYGLLLTGKWSKIAFSHACPPEKYQFGILLFRFYFQVHCTKNRWFSLHDYIKLLVCNRLFILLRKSVESEIAFFDNSCSKYIITRSLYK